MPSPLLTERGLDEDAVEHAVKADLAGDQAAIAVLQRVGRAARSKGATASAIDILESAIALARQQREARPCCANWRKRWPQAGAPVTRLASASASRAWPMYR